MKVFSLESFPLYGIVTKKLFVNEINKNYGTLASSNKILRSHIISLVDLCTSIKKSLNSIQPPFTTGSPQGRLLSLENNYTHTLSCVGR